MKVSPTPHELVQTIVGEDYQPIAGTVHIVKERQAGKDAAYAVAFEDRGGVERRGFVGLCGHHGGAWRPSATFMSTAGVTGHGDVWMASGGWQAADRREHAVFGGWVADAAAVSARAIDASGRTLEDDVVNGVVMFIYQDDFDPSNASVELLDGRGVVVRSGPARGRN